MKNPTLLLAVIVLVSAQPVPAAGPSAGDRCRPALTDTGRNELLEISQDEREAYHYRRACGSTSVDAAGEFQKAQLVLGLTYASRQEYCDAQAAKYRSYVFDYTATSTVVEKALQVWLECVRINDAGIVATPIIEPEQFTLTLARGSLTTGSVNWVRANAGTKCFGKLGGKLSPIKENINLKLPEAEAWTLVCDRQAIDSAAVVGAKVYPATIITVDTAVGAFQMRLPEEQVGPERWASDIARRLAALESNARKLDTDIQRTAATIPTRVTIGSTGNSFAHNDTVAPCPSGKVVKDIRVKTQALANYVEYETVCAELKLEP